MWIQKDLDEFLTESKRIYVDDCVGWVTRVDGYDVRIRQDRGNAIATVWTGVTADDENRLALLAMASHLEGWEFTEGSFRVPEEGEVSISCTRPLHMLGDVDRFVAIPARMLKLCEDALQDAAYGDLPYDGDFSVREMDAELSGDCSPCTPPQWNV